MDLTTVSYPVYKLKKDMPSVIGGLSFYYSEYGEKQKVQIIDDKNLAGETLGKRRTQLYAEGASLFPLKLSFWFLSDLIKASCPKQYWVDSNGKIFKYTKTKMVPLVFRRITNIIPDISCTLVEVEGLPGRYMSLLPPVLEQQYAGLLKLNGGYILYGFFDQKYPDTKRKI